jgi:uncharacterized protein DUF3306
MANDESRSSGFSLRRWSARKHEIAREGRRASTPGRNTSPNDVPPQPRAPMDVEARMSASVAKGSASHARDDLPVGPADPARLASSAANAEQRLEERSASAGAARASAVSLPSIDTLSIDSDYSPFMQSGVDESLKRGALKKLFSDPRFNVMDGLDVYIDDYSKPDPIDPDIVRTLVQARYIFNPPVTRVNEQGYVEDVPEEAVLAKGDAEDAEAPGADSGDAQVARAGAPEDAEIGSGASQDGQALRGDPEVGGAASHDGQTVMGNPEDAEVGGGASHDGQALMGNPEDAEVGTGQPADAEVRQRVSQEAVLQEAVGPLAPSVHRAP